MSFRINTNTGYAVLSGAAALGSAVTTTALVWLHSEANADKEFLTIDMPSAGWRIEGVSNGTQLRIYGTGITATAFAAANSEWVCVAIVRNGAYISCYAWTEAGVRTDVLVAADSTKYSGNSNAVRLGNNNAYGNSATASYRFFRCWAAALNTTQLDAEVRHTPTSGAPAAYTTSLRGSWALPDATTATDWSAVNQSITLFEGATSAEEPTIPGASTSIAPLAMSHFRRMRA